MLHFLLAINCTDSHLPAPIGELDQLADRPFSIREVPGSKPGFSILSLPDAGLAEHEQVARRGVTEEELFSHASLRYLLYSANVGMCRETTAAGSPGNRGVMYYG